MPDNCTNVQSSLNTQESSQSSFNYTSADAIKINVSSSASDNCDNDCSKETFTNRAKVTTSPTESEDEGGQMSYRVSHRICEMKTLEAQRR